MRAARDVAGMKPIRQCTELGESREANSPPRVPLGQGLGSSNMVRTFEGLYASSTLQPAYRK